MDAENLMPLPTSDFRQPVCMEMRSLEIEAMREKSNNFFLETYAEDNVMVPTRPNGGDLASMDSSDTFATCTTYPSNSQVIYHNVKVICSLTLYNFRRISLQIFWTRHC